MGAGVEMGRNLWRTQDPRMELTVPIEAEAIASPMVNATSERAPGMAAGLQLPASAQSELMAPVHVDLLMTLPPKD